jgi:CRP-like cAMP-binding protein
MIDSSLISTGFLAGASEDLKSLLMKVGKETRLKPGEQLMEQGTTGESLYVVLSGALEVSVLSMEGRRLALNVMHPGDILGEIALFDPGPHTATVTAREASHVWGIKNSDVMAALARSPGLGADLIRLAGQRMRWMGKQLNEQVFLPLPARLARKILHLTDHDSAAQPKLALSQLELADFAGASREAVSKALSGWNSSGLIALSRGAVTVMDKEALKKIAEMSFF